MDTSHTPQRHDEVGGLARMSFCELLDFSVFARCLLIFSIPALTARTISPLTCKSNMPQKCVHKGCEKTFDDPEEECVYHPGFV